MKTPLAVTTLPPLRSAPMDQPYWELISDKLHREGFSLGWVRIVNKDALPLWCADAARDGKRWVVQAENLSTAFAELENQTRDAVNLV
jgi:hypothetical protein